MADKAKIQFGTAKPLDWPCGCIGTRDGKKITITEVCHFMKLRLDKILKESDMAATFLDVQKFKDAHKNCKLSCEQVDRSDMHKLKCVATVCTVESKVLHNVTVPYSIFCMDKVGCAGKGSCPRDYSCSE